MGMYFKKIDEKTVDLVIAYTKHPFRRRAEVKIIDESSKKSYAHYKNDILPKNEAGDIKYRLYDLPPNITLDATGIFENDISGKWKHYRTRKCSIKLGDLSMSASVAAKSYDTGSLTVKILKNRPLTFYKINATITQMLFQNGTSAIPTVRGNSLKKTFAIKNTDTISATVTKTFDFNGLKPDSSYTVEFDIYNIHGQNINDGKSYYGGSYPQARDGTVRPALYFTTPKLSTYLSTVAVTDVVIDGLSHTAKVYWNVVSRKANSYYRLFYLKADGVTEVDTGVNVTGVPSSGYSSVTVAPADIISSRDVTFFVRAFSSRTPETNHNDSNRVSEYMYSQFEWDEAKIQGGTAVVTAQEWNRCKKWVGIKVPAFIETDTYNHTTTPEETVTNEEIQDVLDALDVDVTVNDGTRITAGLYNQIASAINS